MIYLKKILKSLSISSAVVLILTIGGVMISYFVCFVSQGNIKLPFHIADIKTVKDGTGYYTQLTVGTGLFLKIVIAISVLTVIFFGITVIRELVKRNEKKNN